MGKVSLYLTLKGSGLLCTDNDFITVFDPSPLLGHNEHLSWAGQSFSFPSHHGVISRNVTETWLPL